MVHDKACCRVIAQQLRAHHLLQDGQRQRQRCQQIGRHVSHWSEVDHADLLGIFPTDHTNQGSEVFAVTIFQCLRRV
jgi:hypothetical protein